MCGAERSGSILDEGFRRQDDLRTVLQHKRSPFFPVNFRSRFIRCYFVAAERRHDCRRGSGRRGAA